MGEKSELTSAAQASILDLFVIHGSSDQGVSEELAAQRLRDEGPNIFSPDVPSVFSLLARQLVTPLAALLIGAAALSWVAGEKVDAGVIIAIFLVNVVLSFVQEFHAEGVTKKLLKKLAPMVDVMRGGKEISVQARDVVRGDVIMLEAGDMVPADARLIEATDALFDEAILSGESVPVLKNAKITKKNIVSYADATNCIFAGTNLVQGTAKALVIRTGMHTEAGELISMSEEPSEQSSFEKLVQDLNLLIVKLTVGAILFVFIAQLFLHRGETLSERLVYFVALAIMMLPEALPVVVTITFARGAMKLAKKFVLVRRLSAIEELGHVDVLCVDKTGTLTEGTMSVSEVRGDESGISMFLSATVGHHVPHTVSGLAYDSALQHYFGVHHAKEAEILAVAPFDASRRRSSRLVRMKGKTYIFVQGAPESILQVSAKEYDGDLKTNEWLAAYRAMGQAGERTLAFAYRETTASTLSEADESELIFLGIVGFVDPLRNTAEAAIRAAEAMKVEVKILTGDSVEVAEAVARKAGLLAKHERAITGDEFSKASRSEQMTLVHECSVFARVSPQEKHHIVKLLESEGHRVAFMGDGMNDAPALRAAHVGLAVSTAADIAKGSADIVLLRSDLHVIVDAIGYGREMFANVRKYIYTTLSANFGNFLTTATLTLFIPFLPLFAAQILLLNLLSDFPLIAVATDEVDGEERSTPRTFSIREALFVTVTLGLVSSFFDFATFITFRTLSPDSVRTLWFMISTLTELLLVFSLRTWRPMWKAAMPSLSLVVLAVAAGITALGLPFLEIGHRLFRFTTPTFSEMALIFSFAIAYLVMTEGAKLMVKKHLSYAKTEKA